MFKKYLLRVSCVSGNGDTALNKISWFLPPGASAELKATLSNYKCAGDHKPQCSVTGAYSGKLELRP